MEIPPPQEDIRRRERELGLQAEGNARNIPKTSFAVLSTFNIDYSRLS